MREAENSSLLAQALQQSFTALAITIPSPAVSICERRHLKYIAI